MLRSDPELLLVQRGTQPTRRVVRYRHGGEITIEGTTLTARIPFPAVDLLYWTVDGDSFLVSGDTRVIHTRSMHVDPNGLLSLLLLGAVIPPMATFREKRVFRPGFETTVDLETFRVTERPTMHWPEIVDDDFTMPARDQVRLLSQVIDRQLEEIGTDNPILLFSGGVDSGVLAYRLSRLGYRDTTLVHYSFGENSPDTIAAQALARELGLPFEVVTPRDESAVEILDRAADLYHQPFCDHSAVPTHQLAQAVTKRFDRARPILDGTGADGAFGLFAKSRSYQRLMLLPSPIRNAASASYVRRRAWRTTSRLEHSLRILHRLATMSKLAASIAQHGMLGVGVCAPKANVDSVCTTLESWIGPIAPTDDPYARMPMADIGLTCAGIFAHKDFSIFAESGHRVEYPFMAPSMVLFALRRAHRWPNSKSPKHALKSLLLQTAPREIVHRPKTGFVSDKFELFSSADVIERIRGTVRSQHPRTELLREWLDAAVVDTLADDLRDGRRLPAPTYNFLWSIAMANSWLSTIDDASDGVRRRLLERRGSALGAAETQWIRRTLNLGPETPAQA
ncbi:MAG: asparagine synthase [Phycisphaerae bacterium]|nr:asparagine synthase [Phycisphaerae bacterium]